MLSSSASLNSARLQHCPIPAPVYHRPFENLQYAQLAAIAPHFTRSSPTSGAKKAGIAYERKAQALLEWRYSPENRGPVYAASPWLHCIDGGKRRYLQPDGLILDFRRAHLTVVEIKIKHTHAAYFSLRQLYEPAFRRIFGSVWTYSVCEVVKWYEPDLMWPEPLIMTANPHNLRAGEFGCHILSKAWGKS